MTAPKTITKELLNVDELLKLEKIMRLVKVDRHLPLEWIAVNGKIGFNKQKILDSLSDYDPIELTQVKALTKAQVKKAAGFKDKSFLPNYKIDGEEFYELSNVKTYLASQNPNLDLSEIQNRINDSMEEI